jgi:cytochrome c oxidase subunit 1
MPRRVYTYLPETGWGGLNLFVTLAALVLVASFVVLAANVVASLLNGDIAPDNPWDAGTLEWATTSPPPPYNFARIPLVTSREPLWAERAALPVVTGLRVDSRELVVSTIADASPEHRESSPEPSIWPLLAALTVAATFVASVFTPWAVVFGSLPVAVSLIAWFWPKGAPEDE